MSIQLVEQPCPLCDSEELRPVCQIEDPTYDVDGVYQVVCCKRCSHLFISPRPADESLMECYPQDYAPYDDSLVPAEPEEQREESEPRSPSLPRRILRSIPGLRSFLNWLGQENATWLEGPPEPGESRMLEIGCAHGGYLCRAQDLGWIVDGIEPNALTAEQARGKGLEVQVGFLDQAELEPSSRDCVAMWMVLEHVPNPRQVVARVADILRSGGTFALSVPNAATWERQLFGRFWLGYDAPRHLQVFSAKRLKQLLESEGFSDVQVVHQSNTRYWWGSIAAWGLARRMNSAWPKRWMEYFKSEPPRSWNWLLLIPGKLNSILRCSGRITVTARRK